MDGNGGNVEQKLLEMAPPTIDHFDQVKAALFSLAEEPDAKLVADRRNPNRQFVICERRISDLDLPEGVNFTVRLGGFIRRFSNGCRLGVLQRQIIHSNQTLDAGITHSYLMKREGNRLTEFWHAVHAFPELDEQSSKAIFEVRAHIAELGASALKQNFGHNMELRAGDCEDLTDRVQFFDLQ